MRLLRLLQRWFDDPLRAELEQARLDKAIALTHLERAEQDLIAARAMVMELQRQATEMMGLVAQLKRSGFAADPAQGRAAVEPMSEEESELWNAIWRRADRGSGLAADMYAHAQRQLAADVPLEEVIGSVLEGANLSDLASAVPE